MIGIPLKERFGFLAPMGFDDPDDDLHALLQFLLCRLQHRVGLPHPGRHPEENLGLAARRGRLLALHSREKLIGIGPFGPHS